MLRNTELSPRIELSPLNIFRLSELNPASNFQKLNLGLSRNQWFPIGGPWIPRGPRVDVRDYGQK